MITIIVGERGSVFRPPSDSINIDNECNIDELDAPHISFSIHDFLVRPVLEYLVERTSKKLTTTVFTWKDEVCFLEEAVFANATTIYQEDMCFYPKCLSFATESYMWSHSAWFPLCSSCYRKFERKMCKKKEKVLLVERT
jgi:hypothetical protein